jgi:hypothetical protein
MGVHKRAHPTYSRGFAVGRRGAGMIKLIQCIARKPELSVPEFRSHLVEYRDRVQRLADALDAVRVTVCPTLQVEQNLEIMLSRGTSEPFDAVVAIWLERAPDLGAGTDGEHVRSLLDEMRELQREFMDLTHSSFFFAAEDVVFDRSTN